MDLLGENLPPRVRVLIDSGQDLALDYAVDANVEVEAGQRVRVPLRGRSVTGTILQVLEQNQGEAVKGLKKVEKIWPREQGMTPGLIRLAQWLSQYYLCPLDVVLKAILPGGLREGANSLQRKAVQLSSLPQETILDENGVPQSLHRAKRQQALWLYLQQENKAVLLLQLEKKGWNRAVVEGLVKKGLATVVTVELERNPWEQEELVASQKLSLSEEQAEALQVLTEEMKQAKPKPLLLFGVTGSGKTEVFLQATEQVISQGKQVLVLVPEIALTPQTIRRFKSRFLAQAKRVAVLHSHLSSGERDDQWRRIRKGEADIVIGARSAVFAPLQRLGLIVVDEEHEASYKQDKNPRYQGRDVAVMRGHIEDCAVLLSSATPSVESWANVQAEKYRMAEMKKRVDGQNLPLVRVLDMKQEQQRLEHKQIPIFSEPLRQALGTCFEKGQQAILFLNRRGYSRAIECKECREVVLCRHCELAMTYHRSEQVLICHLCGYRSLVPKSCESCGSKEMAQVGFGTQHVEEVFAKIFPHISAARIDTDTITKKNALQELLHNFQTGKHQVLIGTQMIAKGLHVPNLTLVGVLNADIGLHAPDFRASERVFQLLVQVSGRAGRGEEEGEVVVQSYIPHNAAIQFARQHDVEGCMEDLLHWRKMVKHPPFSRLVLLSTRSPKQDLGLFALENLVKRLKKLLPNSVELGEPAPSPMSKAQDLYRAQVLLRAPNVQAYQQPLSQAITATPMPHDVQLIVDVDPYYFG